MTTPNKAINTAYTGATDLTLTEIKYLYDNLNNLKPEEQLEVLKIVEELEERKRVQECRDDLIQFCIAMQPDYKVGRHHKILADLLMQVAQGKKDRICVNIPPRHGKQVADSTPVLTTHGWKTHGELKVGDYVFHPSGVPTPVLAISEKTPSDYVVELRNNDTIRCHENHEWLVYSRDSAKLKIVPTKWFIEPVPAGRFAGQMRKITVNSSPTKTSKKRKNRYNFQLPAINPLQYPDADLPIDPYFLGAWLGDGRSSGPEMCYHPKDREVIAEIERRGIKISSESVNKHTGVHRAYFGLQGHKDALRAMGVLNNKHIPEIYLRASVRQRLELLAGLVDTDGHINKFSGRARITTASVPLRDSIIELLVGLGQYPNVYTAQPTVSTSGIVGRKPTFYIGFQPSLSIPTVIPRKRTVRVTARQRSAVMSVRYEPNGEVGHCIQVGSPDGMYLVGKNLTPTHNSQLVSIYFPAWFLGRYPNKKVLMVSHTTDLAVDFGRKVRNLIDTEEFRRIFPTMSLAQDSKSAGRWDTNAGGTFYACGIGSALAGRGADLLLVDDPHSEQDVLNGNFEVFEKAYEWFTYGARTRLMPGGRVAVVSTRWHMDDLSGRLIKDMTQNDMADQYEIVEFPAILQKEDPKTGDVVERALWPEWMPLEALLKTKASMPLFQWNAQYQQQPTAEEAAIIKREWWNWWKPETPPNCDYVIMTLDAAAEKTTRSDFTAITTWGVFTQYDDDNRPETNIILLNSIKDRLEFPELKELALREYKFWNPDAFIVEKKSSGTPLYQELRRMGLSVSEFTPHRGTGDKLARLNSVADIIRSGLVWVPETRWAEELVEEVAGFPFMSHDDLVDATTMALMRFRQGGFIKLTSDMQDEPRNFRRRREGYY